MPSRSGCAQTRPTTDRRFFSAPSNKPPLRALSCGCRPGSIAPAHLQPERWCRHRHRLEADTAVTGNVIENASYAGIAAGWGSYLRDVAITSNVIRRAEFGIAVSVASGAGAAVIADNMISEARGSAIVGMEWKKPVTGDFAKDGAARGAQLSIVGNRVR
jgi:uncharacterized secreted repeat protein (TIGR03808 family)